MSNPPRHTLLALAALTLLSEPALAQSTNNTTTNNTTTVTVHARPSAPAPVQTTTQTKAPSAPTLFPNSRLPVRLNAPVLAPYDNSSFRTIGGQPATGADATMSQDGGPQ